MTTCTVCNGTGIRFLPDAEYHPIQPCFCGAAATEHEEKTMTTDVTFEVTVNELEANTIRRIISMRPHLADIVVHKDTKEHMFEGDFIYRMKEKEITPLTDEAMHHLGELLAVMHGDGGHYQEYHGTEKAIKDALGLLHKKWRHTAERDALKAEVERLLGGLRAMEPYFVHTCNYRNTLDEACVECLRERLLSPEGTQR